MGRWRASTVKASLAVTKLGSCASSERAWRLWAARHFQEEAGPLDAQPLPRVLEPAASTAADFTAFDHVGVPQQVEERPDAEALSVQVLTMHAWTLTTALQP